MRAIRYSTDKRLDSGDRNDAYAGASLVGGLRSLSRPATRGVLGVVPSASSRPGGLGSHPIPPAARSRPKNPIVVPGAFLYVPGRHKTETRTGAQTQTLLHITVTVLFVVFFFGGGGDLGRFSSLPGPSPAVAASGGRPPAALTGALPGSH